MLSAGNLASEQRNVTISGMPKSIQSDQTIEMTSNEEENKYAIEDSEAFVYASPQYHHALS